MPKRRERKYYFLNHGLDALTALPNFIWRTGEPNEPRVFKRVGLGDRWIAFAYTTSDERERPISQITGFFECVREAHFDKIPPGGKAISLGKKWAWLIEGRAYRSQPPEPVDVPSIEALLKRNTFKGQTLIGISGAEFEDIRRSVIACSGGKIGLSIKSGHPEMETYWEGVQRRILSNVYERDPRARSACLDHYGYSCTVCRFDFSFRYGDSMKRVIHVHHLRPISKVKRRRKVDPIADLRPVCPNCHAIIHSRKEPLTIGEARELRNG